MIPVELKFLSIYITFIFIFISPAGHDHHIASTKGRGALEEPLRGGGGGRRGGQLFFSCFQIIHSIGKGRSQISPE